jgi:hypothetical protein
MQEISIESNVNVLEFINRLRALTTNNVNAATILVGGRKLHFNLFRRIDLKNSC